MTNSKPAQGGTKAAKPAKAPATFLNIRCRLDNKKDWKDAARSQQWVLSPWGKPTKKLAAWAVAVLNQAAERELANRKLSGRKPRRKK